MLYLIEAAVAIMVNSLLSECFKLRVPYQQESSWFEQTQCKHNFWSLSVGPPKYHFHYIPIVIILSIDGTSEPFELEIFALWLEVCSLNLAPVRQQHMLNTRIGRHDYEVHAEKASYKGGTKNCRYLGCHHLWDSLEQSRLNIALTWTIDAYYCILISMNPLWVRFIPFSCPRYRAFLVQKSWSIENADLAVATWASLIHSRISEHTPPPKNTNLPNRFEWHWMTTCSPPLIPL